MFKDAHQKIFDKLLDRFIEAGPGIIAGIMIFSWSNAKFADLAYHHRP